MIFRIYHQTKGGHVHCRLFAGKQEGALGKCGDLTMRVTEFAEFQRITEENPGLIDVRPEPGPPDGVTHSARLVDALAFCLDLGREELPHVRGRALRNMARIWGVRARWWEPSFIVRRRLRRQIIGRPLR
jgi:hypothetical protein